MHLEKHLPQSWRRSRWVWPAFAAAAVVLILVIVVPCAVLIPKKKHHYYSSAVILPLYIYPSNDSSWAPVFDAARSHPGLNFTVIVNPSSGPGSSALPSTDYAAAVRQLNAFSNIKTVGYVRTGYATRNLSDVVDEVNTYAGWAANSSDLGMHGIFFDEAPHQYTADAVEFMVHADAAVKDVSGLGDRTIIHNPGTIPASEFNVTTPDITVIFESDYAAWTSAQAAAVKAVSSVANRAAHSLMLNSAPAAMGNGTLGELVTAMSESAAYLFVTEATAGFYESFAGDWDEFVDEMASNSNRSRSS